MVKFITGIYLKIFQKEKGKEPEVCYVECYVMLNVMKNVMLKLSDRYIRAYVFKSLLFCFLYFYA